MVAKVEMSDQELQGARLLARVEGPKDLLQAQPSAFAPSAPAPATAPSVGNFGI